MPTPLFDDPIHVYNIMRYTYKWLVCVSAHPHFLARQFKRPWALTRENMVKIYEIPSNALRRKFSLEFIFAMQ